MPLNAKLVVVGGDVKTTEIILKLPSTIGRGRGTAVVLPHPLVSRQHCELFESGGQLMVRDLGSLNGTFVNNERITESILGPGELLTVGTVTFRAVYDTEGAPKAAASTLKEKPGEKTVKVAKATTMATSAKQAPAKKATQDSSGPLEFDFGGAPAAAKESTEQDDPGGPNNVTVPLKPAKAENKPRPAPAAKDEKKPSKPPPPADDSSSDADMDKRVSSSSDDDLNDFLDSLKGK